MDREISYAIRAICAEPGILSPYDHKRLLRVLLSNASPESLKDVFGKLPLKPVEGLRETAIHFLRNYQKKVSFQAGDELVETERQFNDKPKGMVRRGKLLHISTDPITNGSERPEDIWIDGVPHFRRFYVACVGPEWDIHRIGTVNHEWVSEEQLRNNWMPDPVRVGAEIYGYRKIMRTVEGSFRSAWFKSGEYE